ncbi:MAG: PLP-dependent aspartate aminotransferase family protein [Candidatus Sericytochromatia bacterium]
MMDLSYIINQLGEERENYFNAVSPPIIQTSNFAFKDVDSMTYALANEKEIPCYTRGNNPTVEILRKKVAALEKTEDSLIMSSGMAAISTAVLANIKSGDHIVCVSNPYGWTKKLLGSFLLKFNVEVTFIDGKETENFLKNTKDNTKLYFLESPNSLTFELQDLETISKIAKDKNIITILDNSYSSPINQNPHELGIDIVVHSATKYIGGHSDVVAGTICSTKDMIKKIFHDEFMTLGGIISPNDAWLMIRGLRTLEIRMERVKSTTEKILEYFENNKKVKNIFYPFYKKNPQYDLALKQMKAGSGLITIELNTNNLDEIKDFCNSLKRFLFAVSWGGYESLVLPTCVLPNMKNNLVRFSIGLESADVLIEDLKNAFEKIKEIS